MPKIKPSDVPLKNSYSDLEFRYVAIRTSRDVKTLLYMLKEYETKARGVKMFNDDIIILLCACYMDKYNLDFWNPEKPQYKRVGRLLNNG